MRSINYILNDKHFTSNTSNVLDVKCFSFNIELQHIGMSSIKKLIIYLVYKY